MPVAAFEPEIRWALLIVAVAVAWTPNASPEMVPVLAVRLTVWPTIASPFAAAAWIVPELLAVRVPEVAAPNDPPEIPPEFVRSRVPPVVMPIPLTAEPPAMVLVLKTRALLRKKTPL